MMIETFKVILLIVNIFLTGFVLLFVSKRRKLLNEEDGTDVDGSEANRKKVLVVIAHPDDEAMFFVPTIVSLVELYQVHLMCLSKGDFAGLGDTRSAELKKSCAELGIQAIHCNIIDHKAMQDGSAEQWPKEIVAKHVEQYVTSHAIENIVTFDVHGVSGHNDHIATHLGVT